MQWLLGGSIYPSLTDAENAMWAKAYRFSLLTERKIIKMSERLVKIKYTAPLSSSENLSDCPYYTGYGWRAPELEAISDLLQRAENFFGAPL